MRTFAIALTSLIVGTVFASFVAFAWTGPTAAPPGNNVAAPINVGTVDQVKNAGIGMNSLAVFGNAILNGASRYLNFGSTVGSSGYGFRDNAGTMEFKNSGGTWQSFQAFVCSLVSCTGGGGGGGGTASTTVEYQAGMWCGIRGLRGDCNGTAPVYSGPNISCQGAPITASCVGLAPFFTVNCPSGFTGIVSSGCDQNIYSAYATCVKN
jgi:hypothetical protein